jgi:uncharacterized protein YndB with AHSA1/START domain
MKYTTEILINAPREQVVALFADPESMSRWQTKLVSRTHLNGEPGNTGAKSTLVFDMNGSRTEMTETIVKRDLPDAYTAAYDSKGVHNVVVNRFTEEGDQTRWVAENEFQFSGFMWLMARLMRPVFVKQTREDMTLFKDFAERNAAEVENNNGEG